MSMLNRSTVIARPREPYLQWIRESDPSGVAEPVFEDLRSAPTAYLIREDEDVTDPEELLRRDWRLVFDAMLAGWVSDRDLWPEARTWQMFREWFEYEVLECVEDLVDDAPLDAI